MLREERFISYGRIWESGYILVPFCHCGAKPNEVEIERYNTITCHSYNYFTPGYEECHDREHLICIADDVKTCFEYAAERGLEILRARLLSGQWFWRKTMRELQEEMKAFIND